MTTPSFLSAQSANALISELRPTTLSPPALSHVNALLDEILSLLVSNAESINPTHIRTLGIPAVFTGDKTAGETTGPKALGRSAVAEAELELRSWWETNPGAKRAAFGVDGQGTGVKGSVAFPIREATDLLKLKCCQYSTLAPTVSSSDAYEIQVIAAWQTAGGDASEQTLSPAGLWITSILEHVCEHVLRQLARVVARDSSIATAGVQDLYVALCEDESIWGLFKRLEVKESLENAIKTTTRQRKITPIKTSQSQLLHGSSTHSGNHSKSSLSNSASLRDVSSDQSRNSPSTPIEHVASSPSRKGPVSAVARVVSSTSRNGSGNGHNRSSSLLSTNTKNIVSAFNDQYDSDGVGRPSQEEDDFDALVRSGETMKVSLTPSRLKNFDVSPNRRAPPSPTTNRYVRPTRPTQSPDPDLSPLTPTNAQMEFNPSRRGPHASHSRSSSGQRLVARNAATIKEQEDEDEEEFLDGPQAKKESLADMFAEANIKGKRMSSRPSSGSSKRTVPAVVLGSPPPKEKKEGDYGDITPRLNALDHGMPASNEVTNGRKTKRNDLSVETPLANIVAKNGARQPGARRTEAQELADFFNSTNPPDDATRPPASSIDHQEPPKSATAKSFKSFMSRMTGKKDKGPGESGGKEDRPPMPSAFSQASVKRQKSFSSFISGSTTAPSAPPAQTSTFASPPVPSSAPEPSPALAASSTSTTTSSSPARFPAQTRSLAKSANDARGNDSMGADEVLAAGVAALTSGAGEQTKAVASAPTPEEPQFHFDQEKDSARASRQNTSISTISPPARGIRNNDLAPSAGSSTNRAQPMLAPPIATRPDDYVMVNKADAAPPARINSISPSARSGGEPSPVRPTPSTAGEHSQFPSEAASFTTASEGDISPTAAGPIVEKSNNDIRPRHTLIPATREQHDRAHPSAIPISDLVPLRGLLAHATTAKECQLLLGAILSQLGVPLSHSGEEAIDPEARVTAWLLAGREGPGDYTPAHIYRNLTATTTATAQEVSTPTLGDADLDVGEIGSARDESKQGENTMYAGNNETEGEREGRWKGAVRVPDGQEAMKVREEVMGV